MANYINKLIKLGVKTSDQYFKEISDEYSRLYNRASDYAEFEQYYAYSPIEVLMTGYAETMTTIVGQGIKDIRFSRPAQQALFKTVIDERVGTLVTNVNEDTKAAIRDIVKESYREGLNTETVAKEITQQCDSINKTRGRTIARTEIKQAQTTANYITAKERGANVYDYFCGGNPCDLCKEDCGKTFPIDDLDHLPPRHPNCDCSVSYRKDPNFEDPNNED